MSDCPNVEMREALPELLHGRLDGAHAAKVREHVALCGDCAAELELLQRVQRVYATAPAVDTAAIVRALPATRARSRYSLGGLRLVAGIVLLLAGALVLRTVVSGDGTGSAGATGQVVAQPIDSAAMTTPDTSSTRTPLTASPRVLAMSLSELDDLEADELESLLGTLDRIDAAPVAEPDTLIGSVRGVGSD